MLQGNWWLRVLLGLLASGLIAPLITWLPDRLYPQALIAVTTIACVATALLVGRKRPSR